MARAKPMAAVIRDERIKARESKLLMESKAGINMVKL
jgi:hypothetical protein